MNMDVFILLEIKKNRNKTMWKHFLFIYYILYFYTVAFILKLDTWESFIIRFIKIYFSGWQVK